MSDSATPWTAACQASLSITNSWSLLKLMSLELVMPPNHLILCRPLLLPASVFPSIRVFSPWVSSPHWVAKALELQLQSMILVQDSTECPCWAQIIHKSCPHWSDEPTRQFIRETSLHTQNHTGLPTELLMFLMMYLCEHLFSFWLLTGLTVPWGHGFCWSGTSGSFK